MKAFFNIIIQFIWIAVSLIIGGLISMSIFESPLWKSIFSGVFTILVYFLLGLITYSIKAARDPDVKAASSLGMSITRFYKYQRLYDEYQDFMEKHGSLSRASEEKFSEILKQINNLNEWRRYQQYRYEKYKLETGIQFSTHTRNIHSSYNIGDEITLPMEDGGEVVGKIVSCTINGNYVVTFPFAISIVPVKEPVGGWEDNAWPSKQLTLTKDVLDAIRNREYEGTENHYHF